MGLFIQIQQKKRILSSLIGINVLRQLNFLLDRKDGSINTLVLNLNITAHNIFSTTCRGLHVCGVWSGLVEVEYSGQSCSCETVEQRCEHTLKAPADGKTEA